jgi:hypothetical protein
MRSLRKSILIAIYCADTETVFVAEQSVEHKQIPEQDESCQILITRVSNMVSKSNEAHTQQTVGSAPNWKSPSPCCHPARDEPKKNENAQGDMDAQTTNECSRISRQLVRITVM